MFLCVLTLGRGGSAFVVSVTFPLKIDCLSSPLTILYPLCLSHSACSFVSNTFYFVFGFPQEAPVTLRKVLPVTTEEANMLVSADMCAVVLLL